MLCRHSSPFLVVQAAKKLPRCLISPKHCQYFTDDLLLRLKGSRSIRNSKSFLRIQLQFLTRVRISDPIWSCEECGDTESDTEWYREWYRVIQRVIQSDMQILPGKDLQQRGSLSREWNRKAVTRISKDTKCLRATQSAIAVGSVKFSKMPNWGLFRVLVGRIGEKEEELRKDGRGKPSHPKLRWD